MFSKALPWLTPFTSLLYQSEGGISRFFRSALLLGFIAFGFAVTQCQAGLPMSSAPVANNKPILGAEQLDQWLPAIQGKRFGLVVNHTSLVNGQHLVDLLVSKNAKPERLFGPEHGIRGLADAGELVHSGTDPNTGIPVISLYGDTKKPSPAHIKGLDVMVFDMQDVGVRFYTYISTMHYVMEACAEAGIPLIILDRPSPWAHVVDGPMLDLQYKSFVGMHPIPIIHGLTMAELALMINDQGWLANGVKCKLQVVQVKGWKRGQPFSITIPPSPNLKTQHAVMLYPSLCLFEGTPMSVGRGTDFPFQVWGGNKEVYGSFKFTPSPKQGANKPLYNGELCYGEDLRNASLPKGMNLKWLITAYQRCPVEEQPKFFRPFFRKLAGTTALADAIMAGKTEAEIVTSWQADLTAYKAMAGKYLLYGNWK